METKTHWRKLVNPEYLGAHDLMDGNSEPTRIITISKVVQEDVVGENGKKDKCTVAHLVNEKKMILNRTNQKMISKVLKTPFIEEWSGRSLIITVKQVAAKGGEITDALRVKDELPVLNKPELTPTHEKWQGAMAAIQSGTTTIEFIKQRFNISPENEQLLCKTSE